MDTKGLYDKLGEIILAGYGDWGVGVVFHHPNAVGGTPTAPVNNVSIGFDWGSGKIMLHTNPKLMPTQIGGGNATYQS